MSCINFRSEHLSVQFDDISSSMVEREREREFVGANIKQFHTN